MKEWLFARRAAASLRSSFCACNRFGLALLFLSAASLWGQSQSSVSGLVTDPSGAVIPNTALTLTSSDTGAQRTAYLPNVPTVIESGVKDYEVASWNGLSVPKGTPQPVVATLNAAMKAVIPGPEVQSKSAQMGMAMRWSTPGDMTARMKADIAKWGAVIEKAGIPKRD